MKKHLTIIILILFAYTETKAQALNNKLTIENIEFVLIDAEKQIKMSGGDNNGIKEEDFLKSFYISKYEITNEQYAKFLNEQTTIKHEDLYNYIETNRRFGLFYKKEVWQCREGIENHPVSSVTWLGADAYCKWLSEKTGHDIQLPTRKQWIYTATEGKIKNVDYSGAKTAKDLKDYAILVNNSFNKTHQVGSKKPNKFGVYDMTGNVREWCFSYAWSEKKMVWVDEHDDPFDSRAVTGRHQEERTFHYTEAVMRGGGWADDKNSCKIEYSPSYLMSYTAKDVGFRICYNFDFFVDFM